MLCAQPYCWSMVKIVSDGVEQKGLETTVSCIKSPSLNQATGSLYCELCFIVSKALKSPRRTKKGFLNSNNQVSLTLTYTNVIGNVSITHEFGFVVINLLNQVLDEILLYFVLTIK